MLSHKYLSKMRAQVSRGLLLILSWPPIAAMGTGLSLTRIGLVSVVGDT